MNGKPRVHVIRCSCLIFLCISVLLFFGSAVIPVQGDLPSSNSDMIGLVPYFRQSGDTCGLYSMQQVLWWYGIFVFASDIGEYLGKAEGPHYLWELDDAFSHFMPVGSWHTYGGWDDATEARNWVKHHIDLGIPVICCIQAPGTTTGGWANHYVTIVGYDDNPGVWCLHDTGGFWEEVYGRGYDVWCYYDQFDDYWNVWWTASPGSNDNRGVVAADLPYGTEGFAQPLVSIKTAGSTDLDNAPDDQLPAHLEIELTNVGTDMSFSQVSESQGTDGVTIELSGGEITWLSMGSFHSYHSLDTGESSDVWYSGPIQPTQKLQLDYQLATYPGTTLSAVIHVQPLSMVAGAAHITIRSWGRLTDRDDWVRTRSVWIHDSSYRAPRGYGVRTLLPERYCCKRYDEDSFWVFDDDTRPPQFSNPTITPFPVYDSWGDLIAFTMDIVDSGSGVGEYGFMYRWWGEDWITCTATRTRILPGGLTALATIPRSEWIDRFGKGLQYAWYAVDNDDDRPEDSERGETLGYGPVILDDDNDPPSLYDPTTSGDILESYGGDYLLQISASDYSGNCSVSFSYQFNDGPWSDYISCSGPDLPFVYRFYIPRNEWINRANEEIHWKVYAEDMDDDRPDDSLGMYSPVYDAGRIINIAPVLDAIDDKTVDEKTLLTFAVTASNHDVLGKTLIFSLDEGAPTGASIDPTTGIFTWTPTETQGPNTYSITLRVSDGLVEDSQTITVIVNEVSETKDVQNIMNAVASKVQLPTDAFEGATDKLRENRRNSILSQLRAILNDISNAEALTDLTAKNAEYLSAIDHLNVLLDKTDGFTERGAADTKESGYTFDWIITAQGQASIDPLIRELIATLTTRLVF